MLDVLPLDQVVIYPGLVVELEEFRAPERRVSSYYLDLNPRHWGNPKAVQQVRPTRPVMMFAR